MLNFSREKSTERPSLLGPRFLPLLLPSTCLSMTPRTAVRTTKRPTDLLLSDCPGRPAGRRPKTRGRLCGSWQRRLKTPRCLVFFYIALNRRSCIAFLSGRSCLQSVVTQKKNTAAGLYRTNYIRHIGNGNASLTHTHKLQN